MSASDMELGHRVTGSMGPFGSFFTSVSPGHRVIILTRRDPSFSGFRKKCTKCKTYIGNAEMTKSHCRLSVVGLKSLDVSPCNELLLLPMIIKFFGPPLHKSTFGVHYRTGSPGQLGLRVAGFPDHWVAGSQNATHAVQCLVSISLSQFGLQISSVSESCYCHIRQLRCIRPHTSTPKHFEVNLHRARLVLRCVTIHGYTDLVRNQPLPAIWNESVPIQLTQCWFPGLAISSANIYILRQSYDYLTIMPKLRSMTAHSGNLLLHHNYMLALEIASPGNQHCVNCIGTLSFHIGRVSGWLRTKSGIPVNGHPSQY